MFVEVVVCEIEENFECSFGDKCMCFIWLVIMVRECEKGKVIN